MSFSPWRTRGSSRQRSRPIRNWDDKPKLGLSAILWGAAIALTLAIIVAWTLFSGQSRHALERDPVTLCLRHEAPQQATLVLVDQTDALAADSGNRFLTLMREIKNGLPRNARLLVVPFDGDLRRSLTTAINLCSPGRGEEANEFIEARRTVQQLYDTKFSAPLEQLAAALQTPSSTDFSPIAEQIERAINDPAIPWIASRREIYILTDGLQHTEQSRVYRGQPMRLPVAHPGLLRDVTVHYVELTSARAPQRQTAAVREAWREWLIAAGARVVMRAPGYAAPPAGQPR